ncbi:hypothetical protein ACKF11_12910 [Methylobacillus sp. Pita2]|uniref:hypothetical protein n=1 Tax=Methylobacillus sp. Pita2 TaxID=3383245 RepID=UPI0038B67E6A
MALNIQANELPHDIRLIAAVSRLIDLHQSRREGGGAYVPDVPEKAGYYLALALILMDCLKELELERGIGAVPFTLLAGSIRNRVPSISSEDIEYCIKNLKSEREIHYGVESGDGSIDLARTWDTTPLLMVADGFNQVGLTENARLLMRISSVRESWLYSDLDADRLIKAIERGQFNDIPAFCRAMTLDLATKSKQISSVLERPALSELRELLLREGIVITDSLIAATDTIKSAIELIFDERTRSAFAIWAERERPDFALGNLQADLELVLQNVESLSRRFVNFIDSAQRVRQQGAERIRFIDLADYLVRNAKPEDGKRLELLFNRILPAGIDSSCFHPALMVGSVEFREKESSTEVSGYTVDPHSAAPQSRFGEFIARNRQRIVTRLAEGPALLSEILGMGGYDLLPDESILDLFGVYTTPGALDDDAVMISVGLSDGILIIEHDDHVITGTDPIMMLENSA